MKTMRKVRMSLLALMLAVMAVSAVMPAANAYAATGSINIGDCIVASTSTKTEKVTVNVGDSDGYYEIFVGDTGDMKLAKSAANKTVPSAGTIAVGTAGFTAGDAKSASSNIIKLGNDKSAQVFLAKSVSKGTLASYSGTIEILQWENRKTSYEGLTVAAIGKLGTDPAATKKTITYYDANKRVIGTTINVESSSLGLSLNLDTALALPINMGNSAGNIIYCLCMLPLDTDNTSSNISLTGFNSDSLTVPKKAGYHLDGWNVISSITKTAVKENNSINVNIFIDGSSRTLSMSATYKGTALLNHIPAEAASLTFSPNYTANTYTVKFNYSDGTSKRSTVQYNRQYSTGGWISENPTKTGYSFAGWYTKPEGGTVVTKDTICRLDLEDGATINLYPHYNTENYTMTISYNGKSVKKQYDYGTSVSAADILKAVGITSSDKYQIKITGTSNKTMDNATKTATASYTIKGNCSASITPVYAVKLYGTKSSYKTRYYTSGTNLNSVTPSELGLSALSLSTSLTGRKATFAGWVDKNGKSISSISSAQTIYALYNIEGSYAVTATGTISGGKVTELHIDGKKATIKSCNVSGGKATVTAEYSGTIAGYNVKPTITISNIDVSASKNGFSTSVSISIKGTQGAYGNAKISSTSGSKSTGHSYTELGKLRIVYNQGSALASVGPSPKPVIQEVYKDGSTVTLSCNYLASLTNTPALKGWAVSPEQAKYGEIKYANGAKINPNDISGDTLNLYPVFK